LGLSHEQSRSDRDNYITINFDNIEEQFQPQFEKTQTNNELGEYDYKSVMQYPSWGFSKKSFELITMTTNNPMLQYLIDEERQGLTFKDIKVMNTLYKCYRVCPDTAPKCQNGGIVIPFGFRATNDAPCPCICPPGYSGLLCDTLNFDRKRPTYGIEYYGGLRCGGNITEAGKIRTPGYPKRKRSRPGCSWWIQSPVGKSIQVSFKDFSFRDPDTLGVFQNKCIFEKVEIRIDQNLFNPAL